MIKFNKPKNLNGAELAQQLNSAGILINTETSPLIDGNGDLWLDIKAKDSLAAAEIVAAHNGTIIAPEPTLEDKLASVGLSLSDLKTALGL